MKKEILRASNMTKIYGLGTKQAFTALNKISLQMNEGDFICVMGPCGSGKSTFINNLSTVDFPTTGTVYINQREVKTMGENEIGHFRYENLGFIFQEFNLLDALTLYENIAIPLTLAKMPRALQKERVHNVAEKLNILDLLNKYPNECSGGQRQRAAIARALVSQPKLIVADEPTGNLDSKNSYELMQLFKQLHQKEGVSILMVSHDPMVASYSNRFIYIKDGQIEQTLEKKDLSQKAYYEKIVEINTLNTHLFEEDYD